MKNIIRKLLLIIGILLLIIFIKNVDLKIISLSLRSLGIKVISILLLYIALSIIVKAIRWQVLIQKITKKTIPLSFSTTANLAGIAGGSLLPGRIDLVKPLMMKEQYSIRMSQSFSALMIERALDLLILLLIAAGSLFLMPFQTIIKSYLIFIFIIIVILALVFLVFLPELLLKIVRKIISPLPSNLKIKVEEFALLLLEGFTSLKSKKFVMMIVLLSFLTMGLEVLRFYFLMYFLEIPITMAITGFTLAVAVIIGVLTMIPGGIGVTELSAAEILTALLTASPELVNGVVLIDRLIAYYLVLLVGGVALLFYTKGRKFIEKLYPLYIQKILICLKILVFLACPGRNKKVY